MNERTQPRFAVGVPARDEELLVGESIESLLAAADALDDPASAHIVIACDTCTDATPGIANAFARRDARVTVVEGTWRSAGACRAAAIDRALTQARVHGNLDDLWVATTDSDTVVPTDWLTSQALFWSSGDHAVAGIVDLLDADHDVRSAFGRHYLLGHDSHGHVHGANLGIRADAYVSVGGFPPVPTAEDHALWHELRRAGFICRSSVALRVATSPRLIGRAVAGFADHMHQLVTLSLTGTDAAATA
ncbi:MAG: glycosyltransferase [Actinomycetota bacterium]|nr:glycosyltransferase [Actinomycetota bacterium]